MMELALIAEVVEETCPLLIELACPDPLFFLSSFPSFPLLLFAETILKYVNTILNYDIKEVLSQ